MTRERLEKLSLESLREIARKEGVDIPPRANMELLVDLILEAYEEDRDERESSNNYPISMEEKKYALTPDFDFEEAEKAEFEFELPDRYNESRIVLMLRDPSWAFAYWDIRELELKRFRLESSFAGLFLRVHEIEGDNFTGNNSIDFFDIPIQLSDSRWYINLPRQGTHYCIQLYYMQNISIKVIAHSNAINVPRGNISDEWGRGDAIDPYDMLIALSGLENLGVSAYGKKIPQRIISMLDAQYLR